MKKPKKNKAKMIINISGKNFVVNNILGPVGVRGRNSDNNLYKEKIGWEPTQSLATGIEQIYKWISQQVNQKNNLSSANLDMRYKFLI